MRKRALVRMAATAVMVGVLASMAWTSPVAAENIGEQGCTPGYWKNHPEAWEEYSPTTTLGQMLVNAQGTSAFDGAPAAVSQYSSTTMMDALSFGGGPGVDGAARILFRAAVAAYLNAAHEGVGYPLRRNAVSSINGEPSLFNQINAAIDSGDRQTMLTLAAHLDAFNNLGCPL